MVAFLASVIFHLAAVIIIIYIHNVCFHGCIFLCILDGSKQNWLEKINSTTPVITIRDYDHYYARQYHQFDIRKESGGTLFSTSSDDGDTRYLRLTPYGNLDDGVSNDQINHGRRSIDSLSVPNLIDKFRDTEPVDHGTQHNRAKGININDMTFNTFRKQEQVIIDILGLLHPK